MGEIILNGWLSNQPYTFKIAGDAPNDNELATMKSIMDQQEGAYREWSQSVAGMPAPELDDGSAFARGLGTGLNAMKEDVGTAVRSLGNVLGSETVQGWGSGIEESAMRGRAERMAENPRTMEAMSFREAETPQDYLTWIGELAGGSAPYSVAGLGGGVVGGLTGAARGLGYAAGVGRGAAAGSSALAVPYYGSNISRQEEQVAAGELAEVEEAWAALGAAGQAAFEVIANTYIANRLLTGAKTPALPQGGSKGKQMFARVLKEGGKGAGVEAATELGQQSIEMIQAGVDPTTPEGREELAESALGGGVLGFLFGGAGGLYSSAPSAASAPAAGPSPAPVPGQQPNVPGVEGAVSSGTNLEEAYRDIARKLNIERKTLQTYFEDYADYRDQGDTDSANKLLAQASSFLKKPLSQIAQGMERMYGARRDDLGRTAKYADDKDVQAAKEKAQREKEIKRTTAAQEGITEGQMARMGGAEPQVLAGNTAAPATQEDGQTKQAETENIQEAADATAEAAEETRAAAENVAETAEEVTEAEQTAEESSQRDISEGEKSEVVPTQERTNPTLNWFSEQTPPNSPVRRAVGAALAGTGSLDAAATALTNYSRYWKNRNPENARLAGEALRELSEMRKEQGDGDLGEVDGTAAGEGARDIVPRSSEPEQPAGDAPVSGGAEPSGVAAGAQVDERPAGGAVQPAPSLSREAQPGRVLTGEPGLAPLSELPAIPPVEGGRTEPARRRAAANPNWRQASAGEKSKANYIRWIDDLAAEGTLDDAQYIYDSELNEALSEELAKEVTMTPDDVQRLRSLIAAFVRKFPKKTDKDKAIRAFQRRPDAAGKKTEKKVSDVTNAWAAARYFARHADPAVALEYIAHDAVFGSGVADPEKDMLKFRKAYANLVDRSDKGKTPAERAARKARYEKRVAAQMKAREEYEGQLFTNKQSASDQKALTEEAAEFDAKEEVAATKFAEGSPEYRYHRNTGRLFARKALDWIEGQDFSPEFKLSLRRLQDEHQKAFRAELSAYDRADKLWAKVDEYLESGEYKTRAQAEKAVLNDFPHLKKFMADNPQYAPATPLHPAARGQVLMGDASAALNTLAMLHPDEQVQMLSARLSQFIEGTETKIAEAGSELLGYLERNNVPAAYDRDTDSIVFRSAADINQHLLLHEAVHAATSKIADNKSHPATRQLLKLMEDVAPEVTANLGVSMDTSTDIHEFIAEGFSNPRMREILARHRPKDPRGNGLTRFMRAVWNIFRTMVGKQAKKPDSALDKFDTLGWQLLAPSPNTANIFGVMKGAGLADPVNDFGSLQAFTPKDFAPGTKIRVASNMMNDMIPEGVKDFTLSFVPLRNFADMAAGFFGKDLMNSLVEGVERQSAELKEINNRLSSALEAPAKWLGKNENNRDTFNDVMFAMTRMEVDLRKPRSHYAGNEAKLEIYDELKPTYDALSRIEVDGVSGTDAMKQIIGVYDYMRRYARLVFRERIHESMRDTETGKVDKAAASRIFSRMEKKLFTGAIDPYIALQRRGKHWLVYEAVDPLSSSGELVPYKELFESAEERDAAMAEIQQLAESNPEYRIDNVHSYITTDGYLQNQKPPTQYVKQVLSILKEEDVDQRALDQIVEAAINMAPERSFLHSLQVRDNVRGYRGDVGPRQTSERAARAAGEPANMLERMKRRNAHYDMVAGTYGRAASQARQLSRMRYGIRMERFRSELAEKHGEMMRKGVPGADAEYGAKLAEEAVKRSYAITQMNRTALSRNATAFGFMMTLGFNVSSAAVNMLALPTIVLSYLGGQYGFVDTMRAMQGAMKTFFAGGRDHTGKTIGPDGKAKDMRFQGSWLDYSLQNIDFDSPAGRQFARYRDLAKVAAREGVFNRSLMYDHLDLDEAPEVSGTRSIWEKARLASGYIFHHSERFARETTLMTSYDLELKKAVESSNVWNSVDELVNDTSDTARAMRRKAARQAVYNTDMTNGSIAAAAAPRAAQGNWGSVLLLYKRYALAMLSMQMTMLNRAIRKPDIELLTTDPEAYQAAVEMRKAARVQLAALYGSLTAASGLAGLPLYGTVSDLWDLLFTDEDEESFDTLVRTSLGELGYKGLINYVTGVEVSSRVGLNDMFFRESIRSSEYPMLFDLMEQMGGPVVGITLNVDRGIRTIADGHLGRGLETIMPAAFRNIVRSGRYALEGEATTLRGDPIMEEVPMRNAIAQLFGFAPAEYVWQLEQNTQYKRIDKAISENRTKLMRRYYMAQRSHNFAERNELRKDIQRFNQRNPQYRISNDDLARSLATHERTTRDMIGGITLSAKNRERMLQMMREWAEPSVWS